MRVLQQQQRMQKQQEKSLRRPCSVKCAMHWADAFIRPKITKIPKQQVDVAVTVVLHAEPESKRKMG